MLYLIALKKNICSIGFMFSVQSIELRALETRGAGSERVDSVFRDNRRSMLRRLVEADA